MAIKIGGTTVVDDSRNITVQNATLTNYGSIRALFETGNVVASAPGANVQVDIATNAIQNFTSNSANNTPVNFRGNATASLNSIMNTGNTVTSAVIITNGGSAYYPTVYQVDGAAVRRAKHDIAATSGFGCALRAHNQVGQAVAVDIARAGHTVAT